MYIFSNLLGVFVFDDKLKVVDKILFRSVEEHKDKERFIKELEDKHKNIKTLDKSHLKKVYLYFKSNDFNDNFYTFNLQLTKEELRNSLTQDVFLIQAINSIDELDKAVNILIRRLREWYELYAPEFSVAMENHENFVEKILEKDKDNLLEMVGVEKSESIGADINQRDLEAIKMLAKNISNLYKLRKEQIDYISNLMDSLCPNTKAVCGALIGAKLIERAGSLKRLSELPSSTIQILGAEKALFRHMKTGAKPPRHGVIVSHLLIANAPNKMHGKIARALADKISIASKVDYFKGKFIGDKLENELVKKFTMQSVVNFL